MRFEKYLRPKTVEECTGILAGLGCDAAPLAGGSDLIPRLRGGKVRVKALVDLAHIPELKRIELTKDGLFLGSMVRLRELQRHLPLPGHYSVLQECAGQVSSMQIRNVATLGGNTCNASPSADTTPGLLLTDARAVVTGHGGSRDIPLTEFLLGPGKTALAQDEIVLGFRVAISKGERTGAAYHKYAFRGSSDISIVGVGALLSIDGKGQIARARLALAGVGPTTLRMKRAEALLLGQVPSVALFQETGATCARDCAPITDQRASQEYRREMVGVWVPKVLEAAWKRAGRPEKEEKAT